jgi:hypothetical protein
LKLRQERGLPAFVQGNIVSHGFRFGVGMAHVNRG